MSNINKHVNNEEYEKFIVKKEGRNYELPEGVFVNSVTEILTGQERNLEENPKRTPAMKKGDAVHANLEKIVPFLFEELETFDKESFENKIVPALQNITYEESTLKVLKQLYLVFCEDLRIKNPKEFKVHTEVSFYCNVKANEDNPVIVDKDCAYVGTVDLLIEDKIGNIYAFDYKTGTTTNAIQKIQLAAYSYCFNVNRAFLIFEKTNKEVDLHINKFTWLHKLLTHYKKNNINETSVETNKEEGVIKVSKTKELYLSRKLRKYFTKKEKIEALKEDCELLKEQIELALKGAPYITDEYAVSVTKPTITRTFDDDFNEYLKCKYEEQLKPLVRAGSYRIAKKKQYNKQ